MQLFTGESSYATIAIDTDESAEESGSVGSKSVKQFEG